MDKIYYVYRWIRLDTNKVFYVGRGKGRRYKQTKTGRNKYFRNIFLKADCEVEIIMEGLTLEESCTKEIEFIKLYKDIGQCVANMSSGGESGNKGVKPTEEARKNMAAAQKGRKHSDETKRKMSEKHKGKRFSEEHRRKLGAARIGVKIHSEERRKKLSEEQIGSKNRSAKKVIDNITGTIFGCAKDAAAFLKINYSTFRAMLNGSNPNRTTFHYLTTTENI